MNSAKLNVSSSDFSNKIVSRTGEATQIKLIKKMKKLIQVAILIVALTAYSQVKETVVSNGKDGIPIVKMDATYKVQIEKNIVYAQGLSHESLNSKSANKMPLKLDVYSPDNSIKNRPVVLLIHGGGFSGGSKEQRHIVAMANYFAARGWVAVSISYRLKKHRGTLPQEWGANASEIAKEKARQFMAIYPAIRDAKAAMRWVVSNAKTYHVNTDYITVGGGSAGAITAIAVGISNLEDYRDELSRTQDPTLETTNLDQTYQVKTILDFWGSKTGLDILEKMYGNQRFNSNNPSLLIVHGTEDPTVSFSKAEELKAIYEKNKVPFVYYPIQGKGHGVWGAKVNNKGLAELSFDFIIEQQGLKVD